jgi:diacylglycerol kinase family enzyme
MGSANGMAGELQVNPDPLEAFYDFLLSGLIMDMDLLEINDQHYCLHVGDVGVNANIVKSYEEDPNRGMITYAKYFLEELKSIEKFRSTLITEDGEKQLNSLMLAICNARKYGTGVLLNKIGSPFDGKFELVSFKEINTKSLIKAGLSVFNDEFYDSQVSEVIQVEEAKIEFEEERLLQLDGEVIGMVDNLEIKIKKGAIKYISTSLNPYS